MLFPSFVLAAGQKTSQTPLFTSTNKEGRIPSAAASAPVAGSFTGVMSESSNSLYIHLVPYYSDIGIGVHFEHMIVPHVGIGGGLIYLPKKTNSTSGITTGVPGLTAIAFNVRGHLPINSRMDVYVSPGLALQMHQLTDSTRTTLGSSFAIGGAFQFNPQVAMGLEQMWNYAWFDKEARAYGLISGEVSSLFIRMSF